MALPFLVARQIGYVPDLSDDSSDYNGDGGDWWYSDTAEIVKYVIVAAILAFVVLWVGGGAWHAKRRIRNGQQPLCYHRWLVPRRNRQSMASGATYHTHHGPPQGQQYAMQNWNYASPPPPEYGHDAPPQYQPPPGPVPVGGSKVNPDQRVGVSEVSAPSEGAPGPSIQQPAPRIQQPAPTQASNPFRDPVP